MVETPDPTVTVSLSGGAQTQAAAESFAISFLQLQEFSGQERDQNALLDAVASREMSDDVRQYLADDYQAQVLMGGTRNVDPSLPTLIRSEVHGPAAKPTEVVVEVAGFNSVPEGEGSKYFAGGEQATVVWESGAWKVLTWANFSLPHEPGGPRPTTPPSAKDLASYVDGQGWRRLS
jgi:hypothetical protein